MSIIFRPYEGEQDLPYIMSLVQSELSEPYVIYTYRYFLHQWPHLSFLALSPTTQEPIGVIVCKQSLHKNRSNRGYIAMLSVSKQWRKRGIASSLVQRSINQMRENGAYEIVLETEADNSAALSLYASLGFIREKRLFRFYMNGKDAFRLVLPFPPPNAATDDLHRTSTNVMNEGLGLGSAMVAPPLARQSSYDTDEDDDCVSRR